MTSKLRFQPGWATPIAIEHRPSFLSWLLKFPGERTHCNARLQGKCPGLDHCHDCHWSTSRQR